MEHPASTKHSPQMSSGSNGAEAVVKPEKPPLVMERLGRIGDMDRSFDLAFWQAQDTTARFRAAWELVVHYNRRQGRSDDELRLQRAVEHLQRKWG